MKSFILFHRQRTLDHTQTFYQSGNLEENGNDRISGKKRKYSSRFRGMHTMKRDEQGRERCTSCFCCMWICPADAIYIEAGEVTPEIQHLHPEDKYAKKFEIDLLRCIFCGMCEEACPKGAIYLDGPGEMATDNREDLVLTKERRNNFV